MKITTLLLVMAMAGSAASILYQWKPFREHDASMGVLGSPLEDLAEIMMDRMRDFEDLAAYLGDRMRDYDNYRAVNGHLHRSPFGGPPTYLGYRMRHVGDFDEGRRYDGIRSGASKSHRRRNTEDRPRHSKTSRRRSGGTKKVLNRKPKERNVATPTEPMAVSSRTIDISTEAEEFIETSRTTLKPMASKKSTEIPLPVVIKKAEDTIDSFMTNRVNIKVPLQSNTDVKISDSIEVPSRESSYERKQRDDKRDENVDGNRMLIPSASLDHGSDRRQGMVSPLEDSVQISYGTRGLPLEDNIMSTEP